jgi:hypothetical protein
MRHFHLIKYIGGSSLESKVKENKCFVRSSSEKYQLKVLALPSLPEDFLQWLSFTQAEWYTEVTQLFFMDFLCDMLSILEDLVSQFFICFALLHSFSHSALRDIT